MNPNVADNSASSSSSVSLKAALSTLALGKTQKDGTVEMSSQTISGLIKEGKVTKQADGTFRLNVHVPAPKTAASLETIKILQGDDVSASAGISNPPGAATSIKGSNSSGESTTRTINMDLPPPRGSNSINPYLRPSTAAMVRKHLMEVFSLQSTVQQLMQEEATQFNSMVWETAKMQAKGINRQTEGATFNLLASTMASATSAAGLLVQGVTALGTKVRALDLKHKAEQIRAGLKEGTKEQSTETRTRRNKGAEPRRQQRASSTRRRNNLEISLERESSQDLAIEMRFDKSSRSSTTSSSKDSTTRTHEKHSFGKDIDQLKQAQLLEREAARLETGMELTSSLVGVQTNLAAALRDGMKILGTRETGSGRILEMLASTGQRIAERGAQSADAAAREARDNTNKILQMVVGHAEAQTQLGGRIWKM